MAAPSIPRGTTRKTGGLSCNAKLAEAATNRTATAVGPDGGLSFTAELEGLYSYGLYSYDVCIAMAYIVIMPA